MASSAPTRGTADGGGFAGVGRKDLVLPLALFGVLGLMIVPLPPVLLDVLLAVNIAVAVLILLTALQVQRSHDFSVFPSVLLLTTLFRLGLNVSTTRLILLQGANGTDAAGDIIKTFGEFVVGGSFVVGIVVFLVLTLINFVVITKGSGRIAEVSARFTLDALPGRQMSIDSDLSAGLITQKEARKRREELAQETDFFGAMDGSSKFVRGDAIAGLLITIINIVGGLIIGTAQMGMTAADAAATYTVLTVGDGLVAQIPTLLISTSAGVVVTRAAAGAKKLDHQVAGQMFSNPKVLVAGGGILVLISLVPGMPKLAFWVLALALMWSARKLHQQAPEGGAAPAAGEDDDDAPTPSDEDRLRNLIPVDPVRLEVGYALVHLVDSRGSGELYNRILALRDQFATRLGLVLPPVRMTDDMTLEPGGYRLSVHGVEIARGEVFADRLMAIDPGSARRRLDGFEGTDPTFGVPVVWIRPADKSRAELAGYTVVEPASVITTHVEDALEREAQLLLGRAELDQLLEIVQLRSPKIVEELLPGVLTHAEVLAVLRALLSERVCIRDLTRILESLTNAARFGKGVPYLVDQVRATLGPAIASEFVGPDGALHSALFDAPSEEALRRAVLRNEADANLALDVQTAQLLVQQLQRAHDRLQEEGHAPVVLAAQDLRYPLHRFASRHVPRLAVLGIQELPSRLNVVADLELRLGRR